MLASGEVSSAINFVPSDNTLRPKLTDALDTSSSLKHKKERI
jgi:hypothetical protein